MPKNKKKKVIDIFPPKSKKEKELVEEIPQEEIKPEYKKPEELDEVFIKIESHSAQFVQQQRIPENINTSNNLENSETEKISEGQQELQIEEEKEKILPNVNESEIIKEEKKEEPIEDEFLDKEAFFKELEKELSPQKEKTRKNIFSKQPEETAPVSHKSIKKFVLTLLGIILGIGIFYYLGFIVLPKAEIYITSKKLNINGDNFTILVDKNINQINPDQKVIPGNLFTFTETVSKDFNSTGQGKDEKPAKGTIIIVNNFSTSPQILIATTRFEHPSGKIYRLDSRIVVPGATLENGKLKPSSIEATVTADQPGPDYNIDPCNNTNNCKFTIPAFKGTDKYNGFYAISNEPITGGSKGAAPMVTNQDIKNAEDTVLSEINDKIQEDIKNKIPPTLKIINAAQSSLKINKITSTANPGDYRQTFTETITGEIDVLAFKEEDLISLLQAIINKNKPDKYNYCQTPKIEYKDALVDFKTGQLKLTISYNLPLCYSLDENEIKKAIKGKSEKELLLILNSFDGIENVKIKLYPFWIKKVPEKENKIHIFID